MTQIISDTSTLYSVSEGKEKNLIILPLQIAIDQKTYYEFEEITTPQLLERIENGAIPSSSQPSIGDVLNAYESNPDQPLLNITMADGLSGTYQNAVMAQQQCPKQDITVLNSKTLCGPHRYLVNKALKLAEEGKSSDEIVAELMPSINNCISFLIPQNFEFLKRGGRCSALSASVGGLLKLTIVMKQSDDGKLLEKHAVARTYKKALASIAEAFKEKGVDENYIITISHVTTEKQVMETKNYFQNEFPHTEIEVYELSPVFVTQGGPGCLAVQCIKK